MDIDPPILNYVKISGILNFDSAKDKSVFQAHYVWVGSTGKIVAGSC